MVCLINTIGRHLASRLPGQGRKGCLLAGAAGLASTGAEGESVKSPLTEAEGCGLAPPLKSEPVVWCLADACSCLTLSEVSGHFLTLL